MQKVIYVQAPKRVGLFRYEWRMVVAREVHDEEQVLGVHGNNGESRQKAWEGYAAKLVEVGRACPNAELRQL